MSKKELNLKRRVVFVHDDDWEAIKLFIDSCEKVRQANLEFLKNGLHDEFSGMFGDEHYLGSDQKAQD